MLARVSCLILLLRTEARKVHHSSIDDVIDKADHCHKTFLELKGDAGAAGLSSEVQHELRLAEARDNVVDMLLGQGSTAEESSLKVKDYVQSQELSCFTEQKRQQWHKLLGQPASVT